MPLPKNDVPDSGPPPSEALSARLSKLTPAQRKLLQQRLVERKHASRPDTNTAARVSKPETDETLANGDVSVDNLQTASANVASERSSIAEDDIAIVGMGCRLPGAKDPDEFWDLISSGRQAIRSVPEDRWSKERFFDATGRSPGKMSVDKIGALDDVDQFDPAFFGIAPREAARMDPQQRLLLEVVWETLEDAGVPSEKIAGSRTGVFIGIGGTDYSKVPSQYPNYFEQIDAHIGTGNALSIAAGRISYLFDLHGPSYIVDTACSSALVAIHNAAVSLRRGESDAALAGGVNLILTPETTIAFSKARMLSPDGECRPFDDDANGYVRGEGCGIVLLKRYRDAVQQGDRILGVIRGSAVNQDGRTSGITAPNAEAQVRVIREAQRDARLNVDQISYVEAHGTGTPLGDPIEMSALDRVFASRNVESGPVRVGSVKGNIGHTETVSGIAGLLKVLLMFRHEQMPGQPNYRRLNKNIRVDENRLGVLAKGLSWAPLDKSPRVAGVSSFGFGGTNAHLIVEQPPQRTSVTTSVVKRSNDGKADQPIERKTDDFCHTLLMSARDPSALRELSNRFASHVEGADPHELHNIAASSALLRSALPHRVAILGNSKDEWLGGLRRFASDEAGATGPNVLFGKPPAGRRTRVSMVFTGQGSQYVGMGQTLLPTCGVFRDSLHRCSEILRPLLSDDLIQIIRGEVGDLHHTSFAQPAICAIQCALVDTLRWIGVTPDYVAGHSIGEIAALYAAETLDLEQALRLAFYRGQVMGDLPVGGSMTALLCSPDQVRQWIRDVDSSAVIAAMNGPSATIVAGTDASVRELEELAKAEGIMTRPLEVSHAFHSPLMKPALQPLQEKLKEWLDEVQVPGHVKFISSVTGGRHRSPIGVDYWLDHLVSPVRFTEVLQHLLDQKIDMTIEVGPKPQILGMLRRMSKLRGGELGSDSTTPSMVSVLDQGAEDQKGLMRALSQAWCVGVPVDWQAVYEDRPFQRVHLPSYPFQRVSHWYDPPAAGSARGEMVHPLLGTAQPLAAGGTIYTNAWRENSPAYLADHVVGGSVTVPAAAWMETMLAAGQRAFADKLMHLEDVQIQKAVFLQAGQPIHVQVHADRVVGGRCKIQVSVGDQGQDGVVVWTPCAAATAVPAIHEQSDTKIALAQDRDVVDVGEFYSRAAEAGLQYESFFQTLTEIETDSDFATGRLEISPSLASELGSYHCHPTLLDGAFQLIGVVLHAGATNDAGSSLHTPTAYLPEGADRIRPGVSKADIVSARVRLLDQSGDAVADVEMLDADGVPVLSLDRLRLKSLRREARQVLGDPSSWMHQTTWNPVSAENEDDISLTVESDWDWSDSGLLQRDSEPEHWVWIQPPAEHSSQSLADRTRDQTHDLMQAIQSALRQRPAPILSVITQSGLTVGLQDSVDPAASALAGLVRSAVNECAHLKVRHLDVDHRDDRTAATVASWLKRAGDETELASRKGRLLAPRLHPKPHALQRESDFQELALPQRGEYRIRLDGTDRMEGLWAQRMPKLLPMDDEVRVRVTAVGLNFSDVLKAMGLYPGIQDDVVPMGIEICGTVEDVGADVQTLRPGMRVMGVVPHGFASVDKTNEYLLTQVPEGLRDDEAAGIPIVFLTAHHALLKVGRLHANEKVLIHAGAGGVGLAAIQVAQSVGAQIFATAGSSSKRKMIAELGVSADHIFDSRDLSSIDQIRQVSGGVDVVLNSLPGEWIDQSLSLLHAHGRFLEIGKIDIYDNRALGLLPFQDNLTYSAIDLDRLLRQRPTEVRSLYEEVSTQLSQGVYRPLPITRFRLEELPAAMRYMAARKNIGKIVVRPPRTRQDVATFPGTHLISGGSGAIGLATAKRLIQRGARSVDLIARREMPEQVKQLQDWADARGATVTYHRADVGSDTEMKSIVQSILGRGDRVAGVIHAAGVLADGLIQGQTEDSLFHVLRPKVDGAIALHEATRELRLDYFTMLGSVACVFGSPGQSNYSAANAFLEGFASHRQSMGLNASIVHWGPWDGSSGGMADDETTKRHLAASGFRPLHYDVAVDVLLDACALPTQPATMTASHLVAVDVDWHRLVGGRGADTAPSRLRGVATDAMETESLSGSAKDEGFLSRFSSTENQERLPMLRVYLADLLASIMGMPAESIDPAQPLGALGLDSLLAIELKNTIETKLAIELPISRFIDEPSLNTLATAVHESLDDAS